MTSWIGAIVASAAFGEALDTCACLFEGCFVPCPISEWPAGAVIDYDTHYSISDARVTILAFLAACALSLLVLILAFFVR